MFFLITSIAIKKLFVFLNISVNTRCFSTTRDSNVSWNISEKQLILKQSQINKYTRISLCLDDYFQIFTWQYIFLPDCCHFDFLLWLHLLGCPFASKCCCCCTMWTCYRFGTTLVSGIFRRLQANVRHRAQCARVFARNWLTCSGIQKTPSGRATITLR